MLNLSGCEAIKASGHRRVRGKDVAGPGDGQCLVKRFAGFRHTVLRAFQDQKRSMPFIEMTDVRLSTERCQQPPATDAKHHFLHQAQFHSTAVQLAGDAAIRRIICRVVGVQQIELQAPDRRLPGTNPNRVSWQLELQAQPLAIGLA